MQMNTGLQQSMLLIFRCIMFLLVIIFEHGNSQARAVLINAGQANAATVSFP